MNIQLNNYWTLGTQLGEGGFGKVYLAISDKGQEAVVKLIPKDPGADRELLFEELSGIPNIIPILDSGEIPDNLVLVMPRAEKSLRQHLQNQGGKLSLDDAVSVIKDVATALNALTNKVVHRDLKPDNILFWQGQWCLADFGISRYAEATTEANTQKFAWTSPYAAPEQWRHQRATSATDIYALGIMGFEILCGEWPFKGPRRHNFQEQHLREAPPQLSQGTPAIQSLIAECLSKAPGARPSARNVLERLQKITNPLSQAASLLQQANLSVVARKSEESARESAQRSEEEHRQELYNDAVKILEGITTGLISKILENAPASQVGRYANRSLTLGYGTINIETAVKTQVDRTGLGTSGIKFDVIATSAIIVKTGKNSYGYEGREHSLWYCDAQKEGEYHWFETGFMHSVLTGTRSKLNPFALNVDKNTQLALSHIIHIYQVAYPFTIIDQGNEEEFYERWMDWFAQAAKGTLHHPNTMPEKTPEGSWRR